MFVRKVEKRLQNAVHAFLDTVDLQYLETLEVNILFYIFSSISL